ncbi:MAG: T9SS type A sorting domain-containing protein [Ferruginibacter sp.]
MKSFFSTSLLLSCLLVGFQTNIKAAADVTLTTIAVPAANLTQGSATNVLYIAKMDVTTQAVTVNNVQVTLSGTHDADDLGFLRVYFNATAPSLTGSTLLNFVSANFAAPHTYTIASLNRLIAAGSTGYFIIAADVNNTATTNNTIKINGASNPLIFSFSTAPNITNNQIDIAGTQTIQAADVTLTTIAVPAANLTQGSATNVLYIAKMDVTTQAVTVNNVQVTLSGTHDADDLGFLRVYFNATAPSLTGSTLLNFVSANFAAPHTYTIASLNRLIAAGSTGYFIIAADVNNTATTNNTIKINGASNPLIFSFSTSPNITNNQTDIAGLQILPVDLVSFTGRAIDNTVHLNWVTASEINNAFFEIERSADGINFKILGKLNGNGTSTQLHNYSFVDELPEYGNNYYRLKQTDIDNNFKYSNIVVVPFSVTALVMDDVYPNPAKDLLNYSILSPENRKLFLLLSDISGRVLINKIITITKGKNKVQIDISHFGSGNYQLSIIDPDTNARVDKQVIILR